MLPVNKFIANGFLLYGFETFLINKTFGRAVRQLSPSGVFSRIVLHVLFLCSFYNIPVIARNIQKQKRSDKGPVPL